MVSRETLLAAVQRRHKEVESVPFGGTLSVQELTRAEWRAASDAAATESDADGIPQVLLEPYYAHIFAAGVIDETGAPVWTVAQISEFPNRGGLFDEVGRIAQLILALSDQEPDAVKKK